MSNAEPAAVAAPVAADPAPVGVVVPDPAPVAPTGQTAANSVPGWAKYAAKALLAAVAVAVAYLISVLQSGGSLADVTLVEWLTLGYLELGAFGVTYAVPNGPRPGANVSGLGL